MMKITKRNLFQILTAQDFAVILSASDDEKKPTHLTLIDQRAEYQYFPVFFVDMNINLKEKSALDILDQIAGSISISNTCLAEIAAAQFTDAEDTEEKERILQELIDQIDAFDRLVCVMNEVLEPAPRKKQMLS